MMGRILPALCQCALLASLLAGCPFQLFLSPGGGSNETPFFDNLGGGSRGLVEGYVFAPGPGSSETDLNILADLADPMSYREAAGIQVSLSGTSWSATTNSEGRYEISDVEPGRYELRAEDPQGQWGTVTALIQVLAARVTSGDRSPALIGSVRITPYMPLGQEDTWRYTTTRGDRLRSRNAVTEVIGGTGTYRMDLRTAASPTPVEWENYTVDETGWDLWGNEAGTFSPPIRLSVSEIRAGDSVNTSSTVTLRADGTQQSASANSRVVGVDDLVLQAGRFDNCVRFDITLDAGPASRSESVWLARGVGPVKIVRSDNSFELQSATVGDVQYP